MADYLHKEPCPECGSKDNLARYNDGSGFCFGCEYYEKADSDENHEHTNGDTMDSKPSNKPSFLKGEYQDLPNRQLYAKTLSKFGYKLGQSGNGELCHIAPLYNTRGELVAQKLRKADKKFSVIGSLDDACLFGENVYEEGGKRLVITEGELDALSYAQATGLTWPVVSVPNGASAASKAIRRSLSYIESFEEVVFLFDSDEPGIEAARECADLLPPGKAKIARMPLKDASDMLMAGQSAQLKACVYEAKSHRPDGIINGSEIDFKLLTTAIPPGLKLPYRQLCDSIRGFRQSELITVCAGSGIGKSTIAREIGYHLTVEHGARVGYIFLEDSLAKAAQSLVAIDNGIPLGDLMTNPGLLTEDQWRLSISKTVSESVFYEAFGSREVDNIISRMRYLAVGSRCDYIFLDHVSMVVSGLDVDERKSLDILMTRIRSEVCEATGAGVLAVCHLKRNSNKESFNDGGQISLTDLRGSAAVEQLSDIVVGLERDQHAEKSSNVARIRLLKNRPFGIVGPAGHVEYKRETGRLVHIDKDDEEQPSEESEKHLDEAFTF